MPLRFKLFMISLMLWLPKVCWAADKVSPALDPASENYVAQLLLGILLGLVFSVRIFWKEIKLTLLRHRQSKNHTKKGQN